MLYNCGANTVIYDIRSVSNSNTYMMNKNKKAFKCCMFWFKISPWNNILCWQQKGPQAETLPRPWRLCV